MYQVYLPPFEVLQELFPDSTSNHIINGETIKGKPAYDFQEYWWSSVDAAIGDNRLVTFHDLGNDSTMGIGDTHGHITWSVFVEWLVKLDWKPYGEHKTLTLRSKLYVQSHSPNL